MSNLEVEISRSSVNGHYDSLRIKATNEDDEVLIIKRYVWMDNEAEAVTVLLDELVELFDLVDLIGNSIELLRLKIIQGFNQMRENDLSGNSREIMKIPVVPK